MEEVKFKIENDVPIPPQKKGFSAILRQLKIGQSVVLPMAGTNLAAILGKGNFSSRRTDKGLRVWRIK